MARGTVFFIAVGSIKKVKDIRAKQQEEEKTKHENENTGSEVDNSALADYGPDEDDIVDDFD